MNKIGNVSSKLVSLVDGTRPSDYDEEVLEDAVLRIELKHSDPKGLTFWIGQSECRCEASDVLKALRILGVIDAKG